MKDIFTMKLTKKFAEEYKNANKKRKSKILDEYCKLTEISRNLASKRFRKKIKDV